MNQFQRLKAWWFKPVASDADVVPHDDIAIPKSLPVFRTSKVDKLSNEVITSLIEPKGTGRIIQNQPKGRVITTKHTAYQAGATRTGGRVVKIMPKQLKQMKQAQERVEDD